MNLLQTWIYFAEYGKKIEEELAVLDFNPQRALGMLGHMGIGMLVIFVIIGVIILSTVAIQKISSCKKDK